MTTGYSGQGSRCLQVAYTGYMKYLCLLRGVNVGGKNKVSMSELKTGLEKVGFTEVFTYINSGNVIVETTLKSPREVEKTVEKLLPTLFKLDTAIIKIRAINQADLKTVVEKAPKGFGTKPEIYHSDVLFPMDATSKEIFQETEMREGVDDGWEANGVVYYQRLSAERTKSKLGKIIAKPIYKSITIRSWQTTVKLLALFDKV